MEQNIVRKNILHRIFEVAVALKGVYGMLELIMGSAILFIKLGTIQNFIFYFAGREISEDPGDFVANYLIDFGYDFSPSTKLFVASYLIFYGVVNVFLVIALLKNKIWAYPAAILFYIIFLVYQIHRYFLYYSPLLLFFIILNSAITILVWLEYKNLKIST